MPILFYWHVIFNIVYSLFLKEILLIFTNPLSKVKYYAIRIEFQVRESPNVRNLLFLCVLNQLVLSDSTIDSFIEYPDTVVSANFSCKQQYLKLFNLVKNYDTHSLCRTCKKNKSQLFLSHYGRFFTERTIIAKHIKDAIEFEKYEILKKRENMLMKKILI